MLKIILIVVFVFTTVSDITMLKTPTSKINIKEVVISETLMSKTKDIIITAYNSVPSQTDSTPTICAWGDRIKPGVIAISRDLEKLGLTRNKKVLIEISGRINEYVVLDRTNKRLKNRVDIYFGGKDKIKDALIFGKRKGKIYWN